MTRTSAPQTAFQIERIEIPASTGTSYAMAPGDLFYGEIDHDGDRDWIAIQMVAGISYDIRLSGDETDGRALGDPYLRLYDGIDPSGPVMVAENDDASSWDESFPSGLDSWISFTAARTGLHYISAGAYEEGSIPHIGDYELSVEASRHEIEDRGSFALPMQVASQLTGRIDHAGDRDRAEVDFLGGTPYEIILSGDGLSGLSLAVETAGGTVLAEGETGAGGNRLIFTPAADGSYYLSAGSSFAETGEYTMSIRSTLNETVDAPASSTTGYVMHSGEAFLGHIAQGGDEDWIAIDLRAGQSYRILLSGEESGSGSLRDPVLALHDANGTVVGSNDDSSPGLLDSRLDIVPEASGTYYISARPFAASDFGSYRISVQPSPAFGTLDQLAGYLTDGYWNSQDGTRRSFDTGPNNVVTVDLGGLTPLGAEIANAALDAWETVANIRFEGAGPATADIVFDDEDPGYFAHTTMFGSRIDSAFINVERASTQRDTFTLATYIHEIGHALGLGHQGAYTDIDNRDFNQVFSNDNWNVSVMSYLDQITNPWDGVSYGEPITPMIADIIAIQDLYGAPRSGPTAGNTIYGSGSNVGTYLDEIFSEISQGTLDEDIVLTIYDQGGIDTISLAFSTSHNRLSLWDGRSSDLEGYTGNLTIARGTMIENAIGGTGNDTILGNWRDSDLRGGRGDDRLWGSGGDDLLVGAEGDDILGGGIGKDTVYSGMGNDTVYGNAGDDRIFGAEGNDRLWASGGHDYVDAGIGDDIISGNGGNDEIIAGVGNDTVFGSYGRNTIYGGEGNDLLWGGRNNDLIWGGAGIDTLDGGAGNDTVRGGANNDMLRGKADDDLLFGETGNDTLDGEWGNDTLYGGAERDLFRFVHGQGNDMVGDFERGVDKVELVLGGFTQHRSASLVIRDFGGRDDEGNARLVFGNHSLTFDGINDLSTIADDMIFT